MCIRDSMNAMLADWAAATPNFYLHDLCWLSASVGVDSWCAPAAWYAYKYALDMQYIPLLCHSVANIIKSIFGKNKKGVVLDLDNTCLLYTSARRNRSPSRYSRSWPER